MLKRRRIVLSIIVSLSLSACGTLISQTLETDKYCRDLIPLSSIYSGVITDVRGIGHYGCDTAGKCEYGHQKGTNNFEFFLIVDMPLSLALDTVILPFTIYRQLKYGNICKYMPDADAAHAERTINK